MKKHIGWVLAFVGASILICVVCVPTCFVAGYIEEAATVAREELGPRELLRKYEWFKDASAQLDAKQASISVYASRVSDMEKEYEGASRKEWDRVDKQQMSQWQSEVAGVRASFNQLAAEYNAQMAKMNWRFCNIGDLPEGASVALPREYKTYEN